MTDLTKIRRRIGALHLATLVMSALLLVPAIGQVAVSNVRAAQRPGTNLVDIDYDVTGTTKPMVVTMQASDDDGTTFSVPATSLSGAVGGGITPGPNLRITWDAGTDWAGHFSTLGRFAITADDAEFALIPAGSFEMGQTGIGEPVHSVQVSAFSMGRYEVTKALWDEVRAWGLAHNYTDLPVGNGSYASKGANHPVHSINWWAIAKWCNARSQKEGLTPCYYTDAAQTTVFKTGTPAIDNTMVKWSANGYRLPTEAEWEKAARGGVSGALFPWGTNTITHGQANYSSSSSLSYDVSPTRGYHPAWSNNNDGHYPYTSPVGSFSANGYGLNDMAGNVQEWCWDWYGNYTSASQTDPRGAASGLYRVFRGGDWYFSAYYCRVASRYFSDPSYSYNGFGFRVARSSIPSTAEVLSTFDADSDGWSVVDIHQPIAGVPAITGIYTPVFTASGGTSGGCIQQFDPSGDAYFFSAPAKFLGNQSGFLHGRLSWSLQCNEATNPSNPGAEQLIMSDGTTTLYYVANGPGPANTWRSYNVDFYGSSFTVGSRTGPVATDAQLQAVLSNITSLYILGDWGYDDTSRLDDVRLLTDL